MLSAGIGAFRGSAAYRKRAKSSEGQVTALGNQRAAGVAPFHSVVRPRSMLFRPSHYIPSNSFHWLRLSLISEVRG